jgi:NAD+ synthase
MIDQKNFNSATVEDRLTGFLADEFEKSGYSKAVLGLSGGLDSATVAFLTTRALRPENVLCVLMPYKMSSPDSISDAERVLHCLGVRSERIDITPMVEPLFDMDPGMDALRRGNIMARERMIILYDRSACERALVVGTGNKTEILLGYGTLHGDTACAINPIGELYKTQVRALAEHIGVPREIIAKPPSADLWTGQTDEAELGFTYERIDALLHSIIEENRTTVELERLGFDEAFLRAAAAIVLRNRFKRMPPRIAPMGPEDSDIDVKFLRILDDLRVSG